MTGVIRGIVVVGLVLALVVAVSLSGSLAPTIRCSPKIKEGEAFYCSVALDYPPDSPRYRWDVKGDCVEDGSATQTIQFLGPARLPEHNCVVSVEVYDSGNNHLVGTVSQSVEIASADAASAEPGPVPAPHLPPPSLLPKPSSQTSHPEQAAPAATIRLTTWPDHSQQGLTDGATVQGHVSGGDVSHLKVAVYTLIDIDWELQGTGTVNPGTRKWDVVAGFGMAYAALLVRDSFEPPLRFKLLPQTGGEIMDSVVKKSN